jgi:multidrug efflux pump subunit AcrB
MTESKTEPGHGNSVAAWATVIIVLAAFTIGTLFFWLNVPFMVWASVVLAILGPIVGLVLRKSGYGVSGKHSKSH